MTGRRVQEDQDRDPSLPLKVVNREVYANYVAAGFNRERAARLAGIAQSTRKKYWDNPNSPTGRAVLARIEFLREHAAAQLVPSMGMLIAEMLSTAREARADGKYDAAMKAYNKLFDAMLADSDNAFSGDGAIETDGEEISDDDLEGELG